VDLKAAMFTGGIRPEELEGSEQKGRKVFPDHLVKI
jgi:hypothetical protein